MWNVGKEWSTRKKRGCRQNPVHNVRMIKSLSTVIYARLLFQQPKSSLHNDSQKYKNITNLFCTRFIFTTCGVFTSAFAVFFTPHLFWLALLHVYIFALSDAIEWKKRDLLNMWEFSKLCPTFTFISIQTKSKQQSLGAPKVRTKHGEFIWMTSTSW